MTKEAQVVCGCGKPLDAENDKRKRQCLPCRREQRRKWVQKYPWRRFLPNAMRRCNSKSNKDYARYGGRGIRCELTEADVMALWERDKAADFDYPSLDRINPDGNYTLENCRFLELGENAALGRRRSLVFRRERKVLATAAPDLLSALKSARSEIEERGYTALDCLPAIDAAIAKAEAV